MPRGPYICGLDAAMDIVGGKWKALILWELKDQPRRFGQLRQSLTGISEKMLIQRLRELEADEIVYRKVYAHVPPKVEYGLTEAGTALHRALLPLAHWGERRMEALDEQTAGHLSVVDDPSPSPWAARSA
ncbi:helix-turn-helix domain-containing protein [Streptomyces xanthochromogenes]|uniref:winged helix-turn-helix transcriptional regulator n=1 Tax=Streptomyces xanthochromogenes TaxID=67384 RepID=UPI002F4286B4